MYPDLKLTNTQQKELCEIVMHRVEEYMNCVVGICVRERKEFIPYINSILYQYSNGQLYEKV